MSLKQLDNKKNWQIIICVILSNMIYILEDKILLNHVSPLELGNSDVRRGIWAIMCCRCWKNNNDSKRSDLNCNLLINSENNIFLKCIRKWWQFFFRIEIKTAQVGLGVGKPNTEQNSG